MRSIKQLLVALGLAMLSNQYFSTGEEINLDKHVDDFIRKLFTRGSESLDFPILDPYNNAGTITIGDLNIPDFIDLHNVYLTYVHVIGLSKFVSNKLSVVTDGFEIVFDFEFAYTGLIFDVGSYSLIGTYNKSESIEGHGAIQLVLSDVTIGGNLTLGIHPDSDFIFLQDMALQIDIGSDNIMITDLNVGPVTGNVDLKPVLPWVEDEIETLLKNKIDQNSITSVDLLDCFYNCFQ